jgi:uncharacterized membrane protein
MDQIPPATKGAAVSISNTNSIAPSSPPIASQVPVSKVEFDPKQWETDTSRQDEHWAKAYWRPAMGWLYMIICLVDFVIFPVIAMFLPIIFKTPYVAWQSLSLSNGGLIHMAFGAILGVAAYGRTQEKVSSKQ